MDGGLLIFQTLPSHSLTHSLLLLLLSLSLSFPFFKSHVPSHASREILLISGSLTSCDPGNIFETLTALIHARIRVSIVGMAAEVGLLKTIAKETGGKKKRVGGREEMRGERGRWMDSLYSCICILFLCKYTVVVSILIYLPRTIIIHSSQGSFSVSMDETHFKDLLFDQLPPPPVLLLQQQQQLSSSAMIQMGFPQRIAFDTFPILCAW